MDLARSDLPFALQVEITSHCNLKCRMCPLTTGGVLSSLGPGHMEPATWEEVLALAKQTKQVIVSGFGEPLVNPECMSLLRQLDDNGVGITLTTNGWALTERICTELAQLRHPLYVNVSIDSPDPETYREIRGGELDKALKGLTNLMTKINPAQVAVSSVMMRRNVADLAAFPPILARLGVRKYVLQGFIDYNPDLEDQGLMGDPEASRHVRALEEACRSAGVRLLYTLPERLDLELDSPLVARERYYDTSRHEDATSQCNRTRQCSLPWEMPFVDKDGRVFPCCYASTSRESELGNLHRQGLEEIWHGRTYDTFRRRLLSGEDMPPICRSCTAVPLGEHPLRRYAAEVVHGRSRLTGSTRMRLVVRNTGTATWTPESAIYIGTACPRDHPSAYYHPSWHSPNRVASFEEERVEPGQTASFEFEVAPSEEIVSDTLQIVVEGKAWIPGTYHVIRPRNKYYYLLRELKAQLRGLLTKPSFLPFRRRPAMSSSTTAVT